MMWTTRSSEQTMYYGTVSEKEEEKNIHMPPNYVWFSCMEEDPLLFLFGRFFFFDDIQTHIYFHGEINRWVFVSSECSYVHVVDGNEKRGRRSRQTGFRTGWMIPKCFDLRGSHNPTNTATLSLSLMTLFYIYLGEEMRWEIQFYTKSACVIIII